jgi:lysophospholipase L1-like esterase
LVAFFSALQKSCRAAMDCVMAGARASLSSPVRAGLSAARLVVALTIGIATTELVRAETCAPAVGSLSTTQPAVRTGHERRFAARLADIGTRLKERSFDVIGLGDSIMQRWPEQMLAEATGGLTLNAGVGGDGTAALLWRLDGKPTTVVFDTQRVPIGAMDWSQQRPRLVLILIGTNDGAKPPCDVYWGIRAVVQKAQAMFDGARIVVFSILPRGENMRERESEIGTTNAALKAAAPSAGFTFFDVHDAFICEYRTPCDLMVPTTHVHPTRRGYEVLGARLRAFLQQNPAKP